MNPHTLAHAASGNLAALCADNDALRLCLAAALDELHAAYGSELRLRGQVRELLDERERVARHLLGVGPERES